MYKKKIQVAKQVFKPISFGFRISKSAHQALYYVKTT
jgi:retron-type reverse transcriptase